MRILDIATGGELRDWIEARPEILGEWSRRLHGDRLPIFLKILSSRFPARVHLGFEPDAVVLAHPECDQAVLDQADFIASTTGIIKRAVETPDRPSIVATEDGVFHSIYQQVPDKVLYQAPGMDESCACNQCPFMRLNTMEKLYVALRDLKPQVEVKEDIRARALVPLERMLELSA